jgi:DNA-3-methyladenine glycosylase
MRLEWSGLGHNNVLLDDYTRLSSRGHAPRGCAGRADISAKRRPKLAAAAAGVRGIVPLEREGVPRETQALARFLLGKVLVRELAGGTATARIVETEAYLVGDPACHAFRGVTKRNRSLFLDVGHAYVYLCYGTSYMLNVAGEGPGIGTGVLLRALEPIAGTEHMRKPRGRPQDLLRGPGRLAAALDIDLRHDGVDLFRPGTLWIGNDGQDVESIGTSVRIGLTKGADFPLRYFVAGSRYLSGARKLNG